MMSSVPDRRYTVEEYLAFERASETKHEYYAGQIYAMSGARLPHIRIVSNLMQILGTQLRDTDCEPLCNDMRVKTGTGVYTYPDVVILCGEPALEDHWKDTLLNPRIIIEVLSPSTQDYDRGEKFDHYRTIPALMEYIVVSQDRPQAVQSVRQQDDSNWLSTWRNGLSESLKFKSINCDVSLGEIYRQIAFPDDLPLLRPHDPHAQP